MRFTIDLPALARGPVDRSEDLRHPERLAGSWRTARVLAVGTDGRLPVTTTASGLHLAFVDATGIGDAPPAEAVLLGRVGDRDFWAIPQPGTAPGDADTIRALGPLLADDEASLATTAVALLGWHESAGFCSRCGQPTRSDVSGHSRTCPSGHQEFPRTDPAVIVLVHDGDDHAVLARQPSWAPGRFSVLAGFAEAGESLESTVTREIAEEIGLPVDDVNYLGSQPWPFPRSLMIAFAAQAPRGVPLTPRAGEIEDARWFSRQELAELIAADTAADQAGGITLPGPVSIARRMVEGFVGTGRHR